MPSRVPELKGQLIGSQDVPVSGHSVSPSREQDVERAGGRASAGSSSQDTPSNLDVPAYPTDQRERQKQADKERKQAEGLSESPPQPKRKTKKKDVE